MDLLSMLPLLNGWSLVRVNGSAEVSEDTVVYRTNGQVQGWLLGAVFHTDEPTAGLGVEIYTSGGQSLNYYLIPEYLLSNGITQPNRVTPFLAKYDQTNSDYEAVFEPAVPVPAYGTVEVKLMAGDSTANVYYDAQFVEINDVEALVNSLRVIIGMTSIRELLKLMDKYLYAIATKSTKVEVEMPSFSLPEVPSGGYQQGYVGFLP